MHCASLLPIVPTTIDYKYYYSIYNQYYYYCLLVITIISYILLASGI